MFYRKKLAAPPVQAARYEGKADASTNDALLVLLDGCTGWHMVEDGIAIPTASGTQVAHSGDWIIKNALGEVYPCPPDTFEMTYEEVPA